MEKLAKTSSYWIFVVFLFHFRPRFSIDMINVDYHVLFRSFENILVDFLKSESEFRWCSKWPEPEMSWIRQKLRITFPEFPLVFLFHYFFWSSWLLASCSATRYYGLGKVHVSGKSLSKNTSTNNCLGTTLYPDVCVIKYLIQKE